MRARRATRVRRHALRGCRNSREGHFIEAADSPTGTLAYEAVGGGAGTVSATGGWLQGGGLSTGLERLYGFGVDQVLQIEMVLADGTHVRFGPSAWTAPAGDQLYPQTTAVAGLCNSNVVADESQWLFGACASQLGVAPIPFADLWSAVRGGGGGTFGILTALHYQLHEITEHFTVVAFPAAASAAFFAAVVGYPVATQTAIADAWIDFWVSFLFDPAALGVSEEHSNGCGHPSVTLQLSPTAFTGLWCKTSASAALVGAWRSYVTTTLTPAASLSPSEASLVHALLGNTSTFANYPQFVIQLAGTGLPLPGFIAPLTVPIGHVFDSPRPETLAQGQRGWSGTFPIAWFKTKSDDVRLFLLYVQGGGHLVGGKAQVASDGTTSNSAAIRAAGIESIVANSAADPDLVTRVRSGVAAYQPAEPGDNFKPDTEFNHLGNQIAGPLRSNTSLPCPSTYSKAQQLAECISLQESVWGAAGLARLEGIKAAVDPHNRFSCFRCVGGEWAFGPYNNTPYNGASSFLSPDNGAAAPLLSPHSGTGAFL